MKKIQQMFCLHWFDPSVTNEFTEYVGAIVNSQQKTYTYTQESRTCSKCGLIDYRRVGERIFQGWE